MSSLDISDYCRVEQKLSSGVIIRQDFRRSVRFVFFDTGVEDWRYATHGGTLFVVFYEGCFYGLTCLHVKKDFSWAQLVVTEARFGTVAAGIEAIYYPSDPNDAAVETDILDVAVVQFSDDIDAGFFKDAAYTIDPNTVATSRLQDRLLVSGALKEMSAITSSKIVPVFGLLEVQDQTQPSNDPTLRTAVGQFQDPEFSEVVGLSGSPVFNITQKALCGMVVRGAMAEQKCTLWYLDIFDIKQILSSVHSGRTHAAYKKEVIVDRHSQSKLGEQFRDQIQETSDTSADRIVIVGN